MGPARIGSKRVSLSLTGKRLRIYYRSKTNNRFEPARARAARGRARAARARINKQHRSAPYFLTLFVQNGTLLGGHILGQKVRTTFGRFEIAKTILIRPWSGFGFWPQKVSDASNFFGAPGPPAKREERDNVRPNRARPRAEPGRARLGRASWLS